MTKLLLAIAFTIGTNLAFGQKCEVEKDPFSNSQIVSYSMGKYIVFELKDNQVKLTYDLIFKGEMNSVMPTGSKISFKFENGDIVELPTTDNVYPVTHQEWGSGAILSDYFVTILLSEENVKSFSSSNVTHVKYPDMNGGFITKERSKKWIKNLKAGAKCIQQNLTN